MRRRTIDVFSATTVIYVLLGTSVIGTGGWLLLHPRSQRTGKLTVATIRDRLSHDAPHRPLSMAQAREQLPHHRECDRRHCARRRAIDQTLNAAKRHRPRATTSAPTEPLPRITD